MEFRPKPGPGAVPGGNPMPYQQVHLPRNAVIGGCESSAAVVVAR